VTVTRWAGLRFAKGLPLHSWRPLASRRSWQP